MKPVSAVAIHSEALLQPGEAEMTGSIQHQPPFDPEIRKLGPFDQPAILQHFLRLDATTRRLRFGGGVGEKFLRNYAGRIMQIGTVVYGAFPDDELRGVGELRRLMDAVPAAAEAALSVEAEWQNKGIGGALLTRIVTAAQNRGIETLYMICLPENEKMRHLAAKQNAVILSDRLQIDARFELPSPTPLSNEKRKAGEYEGYVNAVLRW